MVYLMYFREQSNFSDSHPWIDKLLNLFGVKPIVICPGMTSKDVPYFDTVQEAYEAFSDYTWIWLDANGDKYLDEITHPEDSVVYAVGSDYTGFGDFVGEGQRIKLRIAETFAPMVVPMVLYDRALRSL
jgi:hypothetical protein